MFTLCSGAAHHLPHPWRPLPQQLDHALRRVQRDDALDRGARFPVRHHALQRHRRVAAHAVLLARAQQRHQRLRDAGLVERLSHAAIWGQGEEGVLPSGAIASTNGNTPLP